MLQHVRSSLPALLLLVAAACGGASSSGGGDPTPPAGPTCADAGSSVATAAVEMAMIEAGQQPSVADAVAASCVEGQWSAELIACMADPARVRSQACDPLVTEAQEQLTAEKLAPLLDRPAPAEEAEASDDKVMEDPCAGGE